MLLPNFYHPFFLYCVKTPTNDDGNFGELEFLCTFVAKSKPLSKTRQSIANRTVSKSLPEHQPIVRNTLLQRVVAFLSKVTEIICTYKIILKSIAHLLRKRLLIELLTRKEIFIYVYGNYYLRVEKYFFTCK